MTSTPTTPQEAFDFVCYGEILWDILPTGAKPGGAPMNVAYHLKMLGHNPAIITRVGDDEKGFELLTILQTKDIPTDFVQKDPGTPTGIVHATPNEAGEMSYEIVAPAAWDNITTSDAHNNLFATDKYLVFGSLICRNSVSRNTLFKLLDIAKFKAFDINLRPPHYSKELLTDLLRRCDLVKLNRHELSLISSWLNTKHTSVQDEIQDVQDSFKIQSLIVTLGGDGAIMNVDGKFYSHPGFQIKVEDTVGSGDAFLAALLSGFARKSSPQECISFACAIGALVTSKKGAWPEYDPSETKNLREKIA